MAGFLVFDDWKYDFQIDFADSIADQMKKKQKICFLFEFVMHGSESAALQSSHPSQSYASMYPTMSYSFNVSSSDSQLATYV